MCLMPSGEWYIYRLHNFLNNNLIHYLPNIQTAIITITKVNVRRVMTVVAIKGDRIMPENRNIPINCRNQIVYIYIYINRNWGLVCFILFIYLYSFICFLINLGDLGCMWTKGFYTLHFVSGVFSAIIEWGDHLTSCFADVLSKVNRTTTYVTRFRSEFVNPHELHKVQ